MDRLMTGTDDLARLAGDLAGLRRVIDGVDLSSPVPACPGWTLADLAEHVAAVYQHKIAAMRAGARPDPWPPEPPPPIWTGPRPAFLAASGQELLRELGTREPAEATWTWLPEDQTVGFWRRRMMQETVIHRWDAEDAAEFAGAGGPPEPIAPVVADDGIDELLVAFLSGDWSDSPQPRPVTAVDIVGTRHRWRVGLEPDRVTVERLGATHAFLDPPSATLRGPDQALLLALWGRRSLTETLQLSGEFAAVDDLRHRLSEVSQ